MREVLSLWCGPMGRIIVTSTMGFVSAIGGSAVAPYPEQENDVRLAA